MLKEADIQEDWAEIKKAQYFAKRNSEWQFEAPSQPLYTARFEDGKLFYEGNWYLRGTEVCVNGKENYRATITSINTAEVRRQFPET
jgi:breast cancer metastasis-suppressor 1-like protein